MFESLSKFNKLQQNERNYAIRKVKLDHHSAYFVYLSIIIIRGQLYIDLTTH
jgi:hypothetical protein